MRIIGPIQFWRCCMIYLFKKIKKNKWGCMIWLGRGKITSGNNVHFWMYIFIFRVLMPSQRTVGTDAIEKDSRAGGEITSGNDVHFLMFIFIFGVLMPSWRTADIDAIVKAGVWSCDQWANGPMRGLKNNYMKRGQTETRTDIATLWKNRP